MALSASDIKHIRALQQKKFRKEQGSFVTEGVKTVAELVASGQTVTAIYTTEALPFLNEVDPDLIHPISEKELERISGLTSPNKILALAEIPLPKEIDLSSNLILVLDGINDPGNLGTIIRTAKWFGVSTIICSEDCADAYDRKVVQSTMGALFHVNIRYEDLGTALSGFRENGFQVLGAVTDGTSIHSPYKPVKTVLVIGSESHGISASVLDLCNRKVSIPNHESEQKVESLNAAIATAICLAELTRPVAP